MKNNGDAKKNEEDKQGAVSKKSAEARIHELVAKNKELENNYKRALADYQNLEKRVREEKREWVLTANRELILHLLPVLDTLILANKHSNSENQNVSLSIQQFLDILKREGVVKIETMGRNFDPNLMECIETVEVDPSAGSGQDGKVTEEVRAGYTLYDKVLRPGQVKVGKIKIWEK